MKSPKEQLEQKSDFKRNELNKSAGILDDFSIRKSEQTRELEVLDINKSGNTIYIHGNIDLGSCNLITTGTITATSFITTGAVFFILLETGDFILLETGDKIKE